MGEARPAAARASAAWKALSGRQQAYLVAIYDADQAAEQMIAARRRDWLQVPPAAEWRLLTYSVAGSALGHTTIQDELRRRGQLDPGAGSTLALLERRQLIAVVHDWDGVFARVRVRLTAAGRAAVRAGKGITVPARPPAGLMSEWMWSTLARLYPAGEEGLPMDPPHGTPREQRAPSWNALLGLRDRRDGPYMEEFQVRTGEQARPAGSPFAMQQTGWRVRITPLGRGHYERHHACYRELHPDVTAAAPATAVAGAHTGLADHRTRRPAGLVPEPQWRILAELTRLEHTGTCPLRTSLARECQQSGRELPAGVAAMPCGLLRWQIRDWVTRSSTAADQLAAGRPGGPLMELVDVPVIRWTYDSAETLPLACLTEAGRAHYAAHWAAYRDLYPDVAAPPPRAGTSKAGSD